MLEIGDVVECKTDPHGWGTVAWVEGSIVTARFWVGFQYTVKAPWYDFEKVSDEDLARAGLKPGGKDDIG